MPHIHETIDFTVSVYIVFQNKVLLRMHDKYGIWLGPDGHIELDEDPNQAVIREAKEEVGLDIKLFGGAFSSSNSFSGQHDLIPPRFLNRHHINDTHEHVDLVYLATSDTDQVKQGETEKSDDCRWFTKEELDDPNLKIDPVIRHYAKTALQEIL